MVRRQVAIEHPPVQVSHLISCIILTMRQAQRSSRIVALLKVSMEQLSHTSNSHNEGSVLRAKVVVKDQRSSFRS